MVKFRAVVSFMASVSTDARLFTFVMSKTASIILRLNRSSIIYYIDPRRKDVGDTRLPIHVVMHSMQCRSNDIIYTKYAIISI